MRESRPGQLVRLPRRTGRKSRVKIRGLLTLREVCERYGVPYKQVYVWAEAEVINAYQVGGKGRTLYSEVEIEAAVRGRAKRD